MPAGFRFAPLPAIHGAPGASRQPTFVEVVALAPLCLTQDQHPERLLATLERALREWREHRETIVPRIAQIDAGLT